MRLTRLTTPQAALGHFRARIAATDPYDLAAVALFAALAILIFATYDSYAVSNSEQMLAHRR